MRPSFRNSPTKPTGTGAATIETGVVVSVNVRAMTIDWVSQYTGRQLPDLQIMSPYLHYTNGEGFTAVPEIGAICVVCYPSDDESPFVMGFLSAPEMEGAKSGDLQKAIEDPGVETEDDLPPAESATSTGSTDAAKSPVDATYRAGRPVLNPGDMLWQGRDENFIILRRGGVLQIGSTNICQRAYIPILNFIRDFCENWEMNTAAGSLSWTVQRQENDPAGNAPTELVLVAREFAQDKSASIKLSLGSLDDAEKPPGAQQDKSYIELVIAPQQIDPTSGAVNGTPKYVLRLGRAGDTYTLQGGTRTAEVTGDDNLTVKGNQTITIEKDQTVTIQGKSKTAITGDHELSGSKGSKENWGAVKSITAKALKLGSEAASEPLPLGLKLIVWLASHSHPPFAPPIQAGTLAQVLSKKVFTE